MSDTTKPKHYRVYSQFLKEKYGEKVYKLPVALPVTCPNRDGTRGVGGCIFCGEIGAGYENRPATMSVHEQLTENIAHIAPKYKAYKYIPYYQNFSNTYLPVEDFEKYMEAGCIDSTVGLAIATRPDCIHEAYLESLAKLRARHGVDIYIELGLQTVNQQTSRILNRGEGVAEYIDAMHRIQQYGFDTCTHMILNFPWDTMDDVIDGAKLISAMGTSQVKLHALFIVKNTVMADMYERGDFKMQSVEEYMERVITFLEYLDPKIVMQRLVGRAPEANTLFTNWSMAWWKVQELIDVKMEAENRFQGDKFDYLGGSAVKRFVGEDILFDDGLDLL